MKKIFNLFALIISMLAANTAFAFAADGTGKLPVKIILYIAIAVLSLVWALILVLKKKTSYKSYLTIVIVAVVLCLAVTFINIQSTGDYYNGKNDVSGEYVTTILTIRCDTVAGKKDFIPEDGIIVNQVEVKIPKGKTAFDQITAAAREYKFHLETKKGYVAGIGYVYEKDFGKLSGWMYRVNGEYASVGANEFKLKENDVVEWLYTVDLGNDIGNEYMGD